MIFYVWTIFIGVFGFATSFKFFFFSSYRILIVNFLFDYVSGRHPLPVLWSKEFNNNARGYWSCQKYWQGSNVGAVGCCFGWRLASLLSLCLWLQRQCKILTSWSTYMSCNSIMSGTTPFDLLYRSPEVW